ncbi:hypothetical protein GGI00_000874 [Coemansia sp. RSA 2681]|nr:hypothetical protein GGI00_000874 [Coemansia sp. RSA 2681]
MPVAGETYMYFAFIGDALDKMYEAHHQNPRDYSVYMINGDEEEYTLDTSAFNNEERLDNSKLAGRVVAIIADKSMQDPLTHVSISSTIAGSFDAINDALGCIRRGEETPPIPFTKV